MRRDCSNGKKLTPSWASETPFTPAPRSRCSNLCAVFPESFASASSISAVVMSVAGRTIGSGRNELAGAERF